MDEVIEALRLDRSQHRRMDRGDRARMAAREGDEVLVGLFRRRDPRLQVRHRPILEVDHRTHAGKLSPDMVKMRWRNDLRVISPSHRSEEQTSELQSLMRIS